MAKRGNPVNIGTPRGTPLPAITQGDSIHLWRREHSAIWPLNALASGKPKEHYPEEGIFSTLPLIFQEAIKKPASAGFLDQAKVVQMANFSRFSF